MTEIAIAKIQVRKPEQNRTLRLFLCGLCAVSVLSFIPLGIDWHKLFYRLPDIWIMFGRLAHFSLKNIDFTLLAFLETVCITILAAFYSFFLGILFGALAAKNLVHNRLITNALNSFFTLLRAIPTPVWVLLALVCFGFGPVPGIVGLSVHATAFFVRAFSQSFEDVPDDVIDALKVTGATNLQIFFSAVFPAALSRIFAWVGIRLETNFQESAILGMVGAGGVGFAITQALQSYEYGMAGLAIFLVFLYAYCVEMFFTVVKKKYIQ